MCRFIAYLGEPIFLDELIAKPRHSLLRQSLRAEEAKTVTNGDGFGIGWYGERPEPAVYREVMPAWSDDNLMSLAGTLRAPLFFAHVRAATGGGIARVNCHPFRHGRWLFMHNGQIGGFPRVRRALEAQLPDGLYAARRGATDSELLFLLALMRSLGITEPLRFAAALADGEQVHAFRWASDNQPPTLYRRACGRGEVIASEPLHDEGPQDWALLAPGEVVCLRQRSPALA